MSLLADLLDELRAAFAPLIEGATDPWVLEQLLAAIGTDPTLLGGGGFVTQLGAIGQAATDLQGAIDNPPDTLAAVGTVLESTRTLVDAVRGLSNSLPAGSEQLASDLVQLVVLRYLVHRWPLAYQIGIAAGFIDIDFAHQTPIVSGPRPIDVVVWSAFEQLFSDPVGALRSHFPAQPLATTADAHDTMDIAVVRFGGLARVLGIPFRYGYAPDEAVHLGDFAPQLDHALLLLAPPSWTDGNAVGAVVTLSPADQDDLGIVVAPFGSFAIDRDLDSWHINVQASAEIQAVAFGGGTGLQVLAGNGALNANLAVTLTQPSVDGAPRVIGATKGTRFELQGATAYAKVAVAPDGHSVDLGIHVPHAVFVLTGDGGDGLLASVLGNRELRTTIDFGLAYTTAGGLHLKSGSGLTARLPVVLRVGPLSLQEVNVTLGPVVVTVHGLGVRTRAILPSASPARAFDLDVGLQPPDGAGLAITAGPITGGGYLQHTDGVYSGSFALSAFALALSAYGSLDARAKDRYSLAAVVNAQFPPIQLGLGFTLNGVGGLIGINRRVDTDALHAAMRGPGIESIFFPSDPIAQASRLLGDLATYFPAAEGRYVFGPAAKLGWGPRTIVEAEIAVLLELPAPMRIVLVGSVRAKLPTKDHPLITLQVDAVGELDIIEKRFAIDATLRDSTVVGFPVIGDLAVRVAWGAQKMFVVSVGGFHSQFRPPPGFPTLRRVRIPIGADDDPRLDITGFLALTSNTAQVGAQVELYASAGPLNIIGSVGFEALFQPLPLYFEVDLWAGVSLRRGTTVLAGVYFDGKLSGPTPWHVSGEACLSLWFVDLCVDFSASFGLSDLLELAKIAILEVLLPVLQDSASWAGSLLAGVDRVVTSAVPIDATAAEAKVTRVDPMAGLTVRQSVAPFNRPITKFAQSVPSDVSQLVVTEAKIDGNPVSFTLVTDWFAPAQFEDLSDADRLSRDGFEQMDAGISLAGSATAAGDELIVPLEYETKIIAPSTPLTGPPFRPTLEAQLLSGQTGTRERSPQLVVRGGLPEETFVIASLDDLSARPDLAPPGARGAAELALAAHIAANPFDAGAFVIVPKFEAA